MALGVVMLDDPVQGVRQELEDKVQFCTFITLESAFQPHDVRMPIELLQDLNLAVLFQELNGLDRHSLSSLLYKTLCHRAKRTLTQNTLQAICAHCVLAQPFRRRSRTQPLRCGLISTCRWA